MERRTIFSANRVHRYTLWRDWTNELAAGQLFTEDPHPDFYPGRSDQFVQFIGLNPSTADEKKDDPTIRRCIGFARAWGFGALCMTNLFALRATDPHEMRNHPAPFGEVNLSWVLAVADEAAMVVCAWGAHGSFLKCDETVTRALQAISLHCLGTTKDGHPKHPLYVLGSTQPQPYSFGVCA